MRRGPRRLRRTGASILLALVLMFLAASSFAANSAFESQVVLPPRPTWSSAAGIGVRDLAAAGNGRVLAAIGDFEESGFFAAARFRADGTLLTGFGRGGYTAPLHVHHGPGLRLRARAVARQGGRALVAGFQETELGGTAPLLARFRADGTLDRSFGRRGVIAPRPAIEGKDPADPNYGLRGGGVLQDVAVAPEGGRIVAVGGRNEAGGGLPAALVIAYHRNGTLDSGFGDDGRLVVAMPRDNRFTGFTSLRILRNGKVLIAGYLGGQLSLMRLTVAGDPDPAFGGDGIVSPRAGQGPYCCPTPALLGVTAKGRILLGGAPDRASEEPLLLFRLRADGSIDRSFGIQGHIAGAPRHRTTTFTPFSLAVQRDGRVLVAGVDERVESDRRIVPVFTALRYLPGGGVDRAFGMGGATTLPASQTGGATAALTLGGTVIVAGAIHGHIDEDEPFRPVLATVPAPANSR
jgi:uncharacterized delta-60 repeat protein